MYSESYYPQSVLLEITNTCNLRCLHCGSASGKCRPNELTTDEIKNLVTEVADLGTEWFTIIGGEPFMRKDWAEICGHITAVGGQVSIGTNGLLITPEILRQAQAAKVSCIALSIDGTEDTHDYIRQRKGTFERTTRSLRLIQETTDILVGVTTTISSINVNEIGQLHSHLCRNGCNQWRLQLADPAGRMNERRNQMLTDEQFESMIDQIIALQNTSPMKISIGTNVGFFGKKGTEIRGGLPYTGDYLGTRMVAITANGDVKGDLTLSDQYIEGNIREKSFSEIWKSDESFAYNRKFSMDMVGGFCRECKYLPLCKGGDASSSFAVNSIRADAPYCMYRIEHQRGEESEDSGLILQLLNMVNSSHFETQSVNS